MKQHLLQRTAAFLLIAWFALLGLGLFRAQRAFLLRGMPESFPTPVPDGGARPGVNVNLWGLDNEALRSTLAAIRETGFVAVKQPFYFDDAGDFDWAESDRIIAAVAAQGLELIPLLDGDPAQQFAPPSDPARFAEWAGQFAARYADHVNHYIVWDEPNLTSHWGNLPPNPAEYGALLSATAEAVRSVDPGAGIVVAPLAPTTETGPENLSEALFLQGLYAAGVADAFDVVAGKPYGFDTGPDDRRVDTDVLNFSRIILLREVMERAGDGQKAVWVGNFGWNSLPESWEGDPSLWGQTDEETQAAHSVAAFRRALVEWPWMGVMFLENWEAAAPEDDPRWGFSIAGRPAAPAISEAFADMGDLAFPGFHPAAPSGAGQAFDGAWRFSPEYGADIGQTGDRATFRFRGTDVALRVRRADYRARLYVTVDGEPANALPNDGRGAALVLQAGDPAEDFLVTEPVARNLPPGEHVLTVEAWRGWDQWALNGFSNFERPPETVYRLTQLALILVMLAALVAAYLSARQVRWLDADQELRRTVDRLGDYSGMALAVAAGVIVAVTGWLTWGAQSEGLYRRLGDVGQLALTASAAALFYVTPSFFVMTGALIVFFLLVYVRPAWGMVVVVFSIPFYVLPKPVLGYRFSAVEVFLIVTAAAALLRALVGSAQEISAGSRQGNGRQIPLRQAVRRLFDGMVRVRGKPDLAVGALVLVATVSLFFTERLDVATNEWRVVILQPALFYLLLRTMKLRDKEVWAIVDSFVLSGVAVAVYGLWQYAQGENIVTVAGGLARLRSIYGSPNNVALYLGRILPVVLAMALLGSYFRRRRLLYSLAIIPLGAATALTFSKGAFFLGIPVTLLILFVLWRLCAGGHVWRWLVIPIVAGVLLLLLIANIPAITQRLDILSATSILRLNLWRSSITMFMEHPFLGVGLDNFLYAYRERYILDAAWEEPWLNHPHNIVLDFGIRLGIAGLLVGVWLVLGWALNLFQLGRTRLRDNTWLQWRPLLAGFLAAFGQLIAHGLVDHSFFLVDLAYVFYLMLALTVWLTRVQASTKVR